MLKCCDMCEGTIYDDGNYIDDNIFCNECIDKALEIDSNI